jgi:hypothetical protein
VNNKILTMCSTFNRPHVVQSMINSWAKTTRSEAARLVVYISEKDKFVDSYRKIWIPDKRIEMLYEKRRTMTGVLNYLSTERHPDFDYYQEVNDDHVFATIGWDVQLCAAVRSKNNGVSVAYPRTAKFPSSTVHGAKLVHGMGYFFPREFSHMCLDFWLIDIGEAADILISSPETVIDHNHPDFGVAERDKVYQDGGDETFFSMAIYNTWVKTRRETDIAKIRSLIN